MQITKLKLENFMRYDNAELELSAGFNTIVGASDSGKSTIIRALVWLFYNRPSGTEMCRASTDYTSVTITTDTGIEVERYRSKRRNAYRLNDTWFDSIGNDVPASIQATLGVHTAELGPKVTEMLNVSRQMDGPFLLGASGGDAAKILGNLSGITKIDQGLSSLRSDMNSIRKTIDVSRKLQENYEASIGEFASLEDDIKKVEVIGRDLAHAGTLTSRLASLTDIKERMNAYNEIYSSVDSAIIEQRRILNSEPEIQKAQELLNRRESLSQILLDMTVSMETEKDLLEREQATWNEIQERRREYQELLHEAGQCPTCGAAT